MSPRDRRAGGSEGPFLFSAVGDPARPRPEKPVQLVVDGQPVDALPGQTVAAALMATGRDSWRTTRTAGRPRGVFCGIGACFDCLVIVNGIPDVRACQRTVTAGDSITTQPGAVLPAAPAWPATSGASGARESHALVVVGAGPAGMAAALAAADAGVEVLMVDAGPQVGGQFHRQLPQEFHAARPERLQHNWNTFAGHRDRIDGHRRITHLPDTSVWAIEPPTDRGAAATAPTSSGTERGDAATLDALSSLDGLSGRSGPDGLSGLGARGGPDGRIGGGVGSLRLWLQTGPADAPGRRIRAVDAQAVVLAAGAYDRVLPFPGWDLQGVYSAGAAQALAKGQRIGIGRRVLVAGTGPFLLPVAESLLGVGAEVVGLLEASRMPTILTGWLTDPMVAKGKLKEAIGYAALLARSGVPIRHGRTVIAAHGQDRVEAVTTARLDKTWQPIPGSEQRVEVDAVCLGFGFTAQLELAVAVGCKLGEGPDGGPAAVVDADQQTSVPGVFAAGELTGIGGADLAAAEGRVAGAAAAAFLAGSVNPGRRAAGAVGSAAVVGARGEVAEGRRFAVALAKAYPIQPGWQSWGDASTLVCRCEEVSRGDIEDAVAQRDVSGLRSLKLTSRAGLGLCQGRICARTTADLAHQPAVQAGQHRPLAQPVRLKDLADIEEEE